MREQMNAEQTVRQLCSVWFEKGGTLGLRRIFTDDIQFVGTGEGEYACGKAEMEAYLIEDVRQIPEPFELEVDVMRGRFLTSQTYTVFVEFKLRNSIYVW